LFRISGLPGHIFEKLGNDLVCRLAFGISLESTNQAVTQDKRRKGGNIFARDVEAALAGSASA
jgi:hypothetical protein